jgi:uncharacterized membrane protein
MRWLGRISSLLDHLRSTYWFLPSLLTAGAVVLALSCIAIDRWAERTTPWLGWTYSGGAEGARALLSAVAGSMITVVSVTFSVLVVALTVSSQHFGPRLLRSFMRDQPAQLVLGAFTGTFAYCLVVLRTVQGDGGDRYQLFVPHLAVSGAVVAALTAVGLLIYYVHHVAVSMQVTAITNRITGELERAIERLFPDPIGESPDPPAPEALPPPGDAIPIPAPASGYVQVIDSDRLLHSTVEQDATIWLTARPGDFVVRGESVGCLRARTHAEAVVVERVTGAFVIGPDRTADQDAAFGIQQLVEVVLRALSPGTNEPFTAITAIDRLGQVLSILAGRRIPGAARVDDSGRVRVVATPRTFAQLAEDAFGPIADYGGGHPIVVSHVFETIEHVLRHTRRPNDAATLRRLADRVWAAAERSVEDHQRRRLLAGLHARVADAAGAPSRERWDHSVSGCRDGQL